MRTIDIKAAPLTDEERGWLTQRERFADIAENDRLFAGDSEEDDDDEDAGDGEADDDYPSWKKKELETEAGSRTPPVDLSELRTKAEYIEALRAWDAQHADDE